MGWKRHQRFLIHSYNNNRPRFSTIPFVSSISQRVSSLLHTLMQVVGKVPEHMRPDRDNFIKVNWENIENDPDIRAAYLRGGDPLKRPGQKPKK